jgi:putative ATP-binding cassette transporter
MQLIDLLRNESKQQLQWILMLSGLSGAANAALVALINSGATAVYSSNAATQQFMLFILCLVIFGWTKVRAEVAGKELFDSAMARQRVRLMDKLLQVRLDRLERMRNTDIIASSARNIGQVVQASDVIVYGLQSMFMLVFCAIYLLYLSPAAFLAVAAGLGGAALYRHSSREQARAGMDRIIATEGDLSHTMAETLRGFMEVKLNAERRGAIHRAYNDLVAVNSKLVTEATRDNVKARMVIQSIFYWVIAAVVFLIPRFSSVYAVEILEITAVVLFLIGYLAGFLDIIPMINRTNAALKGLHALETELDQLAEETQTALPPPDRFEQLELRGLNYTYTDPDGSNGFALGPVDLTVKAGQLVYIIGGNGSGKSTLIKSMTGLYPTACEGVWLNGEQVRADTVARLRSVFSLVMSDFHLFDRLYGYENADAAQINQWIDRMGLAQKVRFENGTFSTRKLSTGQRKRLALITMLVEDRPVFIFDEWAAEQDPRFRDIFYHELLPDLRNRGKAVISVTHDQSYLTNADMVVRLEYGRIVATET